MVVVVVVGYIVVVHGEVVELVSLLELPDGEAVVHWITAAWVVWGAKVVVTGLV